MNRISWDTTAPRRPDRVRESRPEQRGLDAQADILRPGWDELRKVHRI